MIKRLRFYKELTIKYFHIFLVKRFPTMVLESLQEAYFRFWGIFFFLTTLLSKNGVRITVGALLQVLETFFFLDNSTFQKWSQNHCRSFTLGSRDVFFFDSTKIYFFPKGSQNCCRTFFPSFFQSLFISSSFFLVSHVSIPSCISPYITISIPVFILLSITISIPFLTGS